MLLGTAVATAAAGLACWSAAAFVVKRPRPGSAGLLVALALGACALALGVAVAAPPSVGAAARTAGVLALTGGAFLALRAPGWRRRAGLALAGGGAVAVAVPAAAPVAFAASALGALHAIRRYLVVPAFSRSLAGGATAGALVAFTPVPDAGALLLGVLAVLPLELAWPRLRRWPRPRTPPARPRPGDLVLDRFVVQRSLGRGSEGEAFLARSQEDDSRVALKWFERAGSDDVASIRETRALARIRDPHVVRYVDAGQDPAAGPVLVIEYVDGGSLKDALADGPLPPERARVVAADLLAGLASVHEAGLVHRDVKPSNVLLTRDGRAKLSDFGIARALNVDATLGDAATLVPVGTLKYASPEQARGAPVTTASDAWSAGVVLLECVTGDPVVLRKPSSGEPDVSHVADAALARVLTRALALDPARRYPDARAMRDALAAAVKDAGGPTEEAARA